MGQIKIGNQIVTPAIVDTTVGSLNVTPTTSAQVITGAGGIDGYNPVTVDAVTASIDSNIIAGNIRKDVTILGVTGNYEATTTTLNVTPTTSAQIVTAPSGYTGYSPVKVAAVTSSIDSNITAGNIKKNVTILGVTGTFEAANFTAIPREVSATGVYQMPMSSFTYSLPSNVTNIYNEGMAYAFYHCTGLTSVDLSGLTVIKSRALKQAFYYCVNLTSVDLSSLTSIELNGMKEAFSGCTSLTSLSFPALTSTSFGSYTNQFNNMLSGVTGCTVHFPSNLQSVIGSWSDVTAGFGGTNTTVLFDLPATT